MGGFWFVFAAGCVAGVGKLTIPGFSLRPGVFRERANRL